mgnify:CR=1 FL=1
MDVCGCVASECKRKTNDVINNAIFSHNLSLNSAKNEKAIAYQYQPSSINDPVTYIDNNGKVWDKRTGKPYSGVMTTELDG